MTYVICDLMISSKMYVFAFGFSSRTIFLGVAFAIVCVFMFINYLDRDYLPIIINLALIAFLIAEHVAFTARAGLSFNVNVLAQCYSFLGFNIFFALCRRGAIGRVIAGIFWIIVAYLVTYCVMAALFYLGAIGDLTSTDVYTVLSDVERGNRLFLSSGHVTFALMTSLAYLFAERRLSIFLLTFGLAITALLLSISRVLIVTDAFVVVTFLLIRRIRIVRPIAFALYVAIAAYLLFGVLVPSFNPFEFSQTDSSTVYRRHEFMVFADYIRQLPLFGVGFYDSVDSLAYYTSRTLLFPSDIGIVGMCFMFGLVGILFLGVLPAFICCFQQFRPFGKTLTPAQQLALSLTGCSLAIYSATAMTIFNGADGVMFALIFGVWLYETTRAGVSRPVASDRTGSRG